MLDPSSDPELKEMRREKVDQSTSQANLPVNLVRGASAANRQSGYGGLLPTSAEIDKITRPLSAAELTETVKHLASMVAEPEGDKQKG